MEQVLSYGEKSFFHSFFVFIKERKQNAIDNDNHYQLK